MTYFLIAGCLLLLIYHYDYCGHKEGRKAFYLLMFVSFVCVAGLRYRLGMDSIAYAGTYNDLPDLTELFTYDYSSTRFGIGYILLNAIARSISNDFTSMQFVHALFINTVFFYFFYKNCKNIFTCVFFYFVMQFFNYNYEVLRESCAVAMLCIAWPYLCEKKWIKYYLCAVIATLFHTSGAITLIIPIIYLPFLRKLFEFNWVSLIAILASYAIGLILATKFFDLIRMLEIAEMDSYANSYENSHYGGSRNMNILGLVAFMGRTLVYPFLLGWLISNNKLETEHKNFKVLEGLVMLYAYFNIFSINLYILYRFLNYFSPFLILLLGDSIFGYLKLLGKRIKLSFGIWAIYFLPLIFLSVNYLFGDTEYYGVKKYARYYPYDTVITKDINPEREKLYQDVRFSIR